MEQTRIQQIVRQDNLEQKVERWSRALLIVFGSAAVGYIIIPALIKILARG